MAKKILVVDDMEHNRMLLKDVLKYNGYEVVEAGNGEEGVKMAREELPDLILMDIQMPVMNGLDASKLLRSDPRTKGIKILALSSYNLLDDTDDFFANGFDGYIDKPFDIRKLPKIIMKYLQDGETE